MIDEMASRRALRDHVVEFWRACACKDCTAKREAVARGEGTQDEVMSLVRLQIEESMLKVARSQWWVPWPTGER